MKVAIIDAYEAIKDRLEIGINTQLEASRISSGQRGELDRSASRLGSEQSKIGMRLKDTSFKMKIWGRKFKRATAYEKLKKLKELKDAYDDIREDIDLDSTESKSSMETQLESIQEQIDQAQSAIEVADAQVDTLTNQISSAAQSLEGMQRQLSSLFESDSDSISDSDVADLSDGIIAQINQIKTATAELSSLGDQASGLVESASDLLGGIPYLNQMESAAKAVKNLVQIGLLSRQMTKLKTKVKEVRSIQEYFTANEFEELATDSDVHHRVANFANMSLADRKRDKQIFEFATNIASLLSPPGIKLGSIMKKVAGLASLPTEITEADIRRVSQEVMTIHNDFSVVTSSDKGVRVHRVFRCTL